MIGDATLEAIRRGVVLSDLLCTDYGLELKRDGAAGRWKMSCPFHGEKTPSCTVYDNDASFHCFGCGKGGDVFALVQHLDGLTFPQAAEKLAARAGMSLNGSNGQLATTKPKADAPQPEADLSERWRGAVVAFTDAHVETLATWRGLSLDFCRWLRERELVGLHNSLVAFPVHGDNGTVTAFHVRTKDGSKWFYEPSGAKVRPLVIGDVKAAEYVGAFESQWDAFAVLDKIGWHVGGDGLPGWAVVVTRGAGNAKLLGGLLRPSATAFAFAQNDEPGQDWLQDVADNAGCTVKAVVTPKEHKDIAEWGKAEATLGDVNAAIEGAEVVKPTARHTQGQSSAMLETALVTSTELRGLQLPPRRFIIKPFLKEGDLGFIYARRGDGKTWLAMLLAVASATGGKAGPWEADGLWPVLYVDGEMPADESRRRDKMLGNAGDRLLWLHHEIYFERTGKALNLTSPLLQAELTAILLAHGVRLLVLDNLSCLFHGLKENDADSWELVLPWLLDLRRRKIAVVIVAHAGRSGENIRGTSRREDQAFWVLKLERADTDEAQSRNLRFTSLFTKNRNALEDDCPPLDWTLTAEGDGPAAVTAKPISGVDLIVSWVQAGLESATDIAAETGLSKGQVSKLAKRAERLGLIVIEGRSYRPTKDAK